MGYGKSGQRQEESCKSTLLLLIHGMPQVEKSKATAKIRVANEEIFVQRNGVFSPPLVLKLDLDVPHNIKP